MSVWHRITSIVIALALLNLPVSAQEWTRPQSGWLYVLDVGRTNGAVFIVDPTTSKVYGKISTGYHPDFGLCADGSKLFVVSGSQSSGVLSVFATETGTLLAEIPIANRAVYTVRPSNSGIDCSNDGRWIFLQQMITVAPGTDEHGLLVIDAQSNSLLASTIPLLPGCGVAHIIPWPFGTWDIAVQCSATNTLRLIRVGATGNAETMKDIAFDFAAQWTEHKPGFPSLGQRMTTATVVDLADHSIVAFRGGGGVEQLDPETLTLKPKVADSWQRWVPAGSVAISKDARAFIGSVAYDKRAYDLRDEISAVKTSDWTQVATMQTTLPFSTLKLTADGQTLYATSPNAQSVIMIDASTLGEVKTIRGLGEQPSLVLTQP